MAVVNWGKVGGFDRGGAVNPDQPTEDMPAWVLVVALAWLASLVALFFVWITTPSFRSDLPKLYGHNPGIPVEVPWFGAVGGLAVSLGGIFFYNRGKWQGNYNYWHAFKPAIGGITGSVACVLLIVVLRAASSNGKITADATTFDASAFVFGYAESAFRELVKAVTNNFLKPGEGGVKADKGVNAAGGLTKVQARVAGPSGSRLNVVLAPDSDAHRSFHPPKPRTTRAPAAPNLAPGFTPQPHWNLRAEGGKTIADLTFVNCYVGPAGAWDPGDRASIDEALEQAMSDASLQDVIGQYYDGPITTSMLPSLTRKLALGATVYKDAAELLARRLHAEGVLGETDPGSSVINIMLPRGVVLSTEPSAATRPGAGRGLRDASTGHEECGCLAAGAEAENAVESTEGLGGYHGSVQLEDGTVIYYAIGVYSEGSNGIPFFDEPWKNVVATFYHELNEARTDPDVEEAGATNSDTLLGWYSHAGRGEIGDLPINACGSDLALAFQEVPLAAGGGTVPIQLMWSNAADGPAVR